MAKAQSQTPVPRRKRLSQAERRRSLISTAQQVFARHGFRGATTRQIAHAAGVTEAVIFQHFPSKAALDAAVLEDSNSKLCPNEWVSALESRLRAGDDAGFVRLLYSHIVWQCEENPSYPRLALYSALEPDPTTRSVQNSTAPRFQAVLRKFILAGQRAGRFGPGGAQPGAGNRLAARPAKA